MSQWCVMRSSMAVVILASPKICGQSAKARLVVTVETDGDNRFVEPISMELQSKVGYRWNDKLIVGLESFNEFGPVRRLGELRDQPQMLYAAVDVELPKGELNVGIGRGLTGHSDGWAIKTVFGLPLMPAK